MNSKNHTTGGGPESPASHNDDSLLKSLEPSLWNSSLGRRQFLKRTGAATVGTAIALHGFRTEVLASESVERRLRRITLYLLINNGPILVVGAGRANSPQGAKEAAFESIVGDLEARGFVRHDEEHDPNPSFIWEDGDPAALDGVELDAGNWVAPPNFNEVGPILGTDGKLYWEYNWSVSLQGGGANYVEIEYSYSDDTGWE
jgi:hypothetical protein